VPGLDFIIVTGDQAMFSASFTPATVVPLPGLITGSGQATVNGAMACVQGDEASVQVPGVTYISPPFAIPGTGTLTISALGADQIAQKTTYVSKPAILKGSTFTALFSVMVPATQATPGGPVPDPAPMYMGTGQFVTANTTSKGS
jgi:hypothetical protein